MQSFQVLSRYARHWDYDLMRQVPATDLQEKDNCYFHPRYPDSPGAYLQEAGVAMVGVERPNDRLTDLPSDILVLIFARLSPAALDAARYTCKAWWGWIMEDTWLLELVLNRKQIDDVVLDPWEPDPDPSKRLRQLAIQLDCQSKIVHALSPPDAWRLHYRRVDTKIEAPRLLPANQYPKGVPRAMAFETVLATRYWTAGDMLICLVKQNSESSQSDFDDTIYPPQLVFYAFLSSIEPVYVGTIPCTIESTTFTINRVYHCTDLVTKKETEKYFEIILDDEVIIGSLTYRPSFREFESPFELGVINAVPKSAISQESRPNGIELGINELLMEEDQNVWKLLVEFHLPVVSTIYTIYCQCC